MDDLNNELNIKGLLMEELPYEVVWVDHKGNLVYANTKCCEVLGYSKSEITNLSIFDVNPAVTQESWDDHWKEVRKKGRLGFTATHRKKGGNFYTVQVFAQFFVLGNQEYLCGFLNELQETNFYKNLINYTGEIGSIGGWELNLQDRTIFATTSALDIFNTEDPDDLLPSSVIHQFKDSDKLRTLFNQVRNNGLAFDEILETKDFPSRYIRTIAKPILKGGSVYKVSGLYQDVTEIRRNQNDLLLYKKVIDNVQDLIYVYNVKGELLHYSKSLVDKLGFSKQELDKMSMFDLDTMVTKEFYEAHFENVIATGFHRFEWRIERKDGTQFPVDIISNHLRYQNEDWICSVVRDTTEKNLQEARLKTALEEINLLKNRLENENEYLQEEISNKISFNNIICKSEAYKKVLTQVKQVAPTDTTVLITGESGTGKELLASAIHSNSRRNNRPLIKINCATLPKELIESELFGHKKGAFTGAFANKMGKFTLADGGTIFLDEIGELPLDLQPKLLRVLQDGEYDELGGVSTMKVDVRIIAATNRDLKDMMRQGLFREDLYYRLNVFPIFNIPLRGRKEDIPLLAQFFLDKYSTKAGKSFRGLAAKTVDSLMKYNFPGNIRELENLIERAVIVENGPILGPGNWIPEKETKAISGEFRTFEDAQRDHIIEVLNYTNWRVSGPGGAAAILNMNDKTLFAKMKRLGIERKISLKSYDDLITG